MLEQIDRAIEVLTAQIKEGIGPDDALKVSQAVVNLANCKAQLAHVAAQLGNVPKTAKRKR